MKQLYSALKTLTFHLAFVLLSKYSQATTPLGAEITYKHLSGDTFLVDVTYYRDCNGIDMTYLPLHVLSACGDTSTYSTQFVDAYDITPVCPSSCDRCVSLSCNMPFGVKSRHHQTKVVLSTNKCCKFYLSYSLCCRNGAITTGLAGNVFYVESYIDRCQGQDVNSAVFSSPDMMFMETNVARVFNVNATDPDRKGKNDDSLVYKFVEPLSEHGKSISFKSGYSYDKPIKGTIKLDSSTGDITIKATQQDITVLVIAVQKWHRDTTGKWYKISEVRRDMQLNIINGINSKAPVISSINNSGFYKAYFPAGKKNCFSLSSIDLDGDSTKVTWNGGIPGSNFTIKQSGKYQTGEFCWQPDSSFIRKRPYSFVVTVKDNACPLVSSLQQSYLIYVGTNPKAAFSSQDTICISKPLIISNTTYKKDSTLLFQWDFGDGSSTKAINPVHFYSAIGNYTVKMVVSRNGEPYDSAVKTIRVSDVPDAGIKLTSKNMQCLEGNIFYFKDYSFGMFGGGSYFWDFGNGKTSTAASDSVSYTKAGTYTILHAVVSRLGCVDTTYSKVQVLKANAHFEITNSPNQCIDGNEFSFKNISPAVMYAWDFGDGKKSSIAYPTHKYKSAGTYKIRLAVQDSMGCHDTAETIVRVIKPAQASFSFATDSIQCYKNNTFGFKNISPSVTHLWEFGDGSTSSKASPIHHYKDTGTYKITLTIADSFACWSSVSRQVKIYGVKAGFSVSSAQACAGNAFSFTNKSKSCLYPITLHQWIFGDGTFSKDVNPVHIYSDGGVYIAKLLASDSTGCTDTFKQTITVYARPNLKITGPDSVYASDTNTFKIFYDTGYYNLTTDARFISGITGLVRLRWDSAGAGNVTAVANTGHGCKDSVVKTVSIRKIPVTGIAEPGSFRYLEVYPNPVNEMLRIDLHVDLPQSVNLSIFDLQGRKLMEKNIHTNGIFNESIPMQNMPAGLYLLKVSSERDQKFVPVIKN